MWYRFLGGRKAYLGILSAIVGLVAWFSLPAEAKSVNVIQFLGYWLACFGVYAYHNIKEHKIKNGNGK